MRLMNNLLLKNKLRAIEKLKQASEKTSVGKVGFVSGKIMADGLILSFLNLGKIVRHTRNVRKKVDFPVFSAVDFLFGELLHSTYFGKQAGDQYWREIFESNYITDVYMTSGWDKSRGAVNEYNIAKENKLRIHLIG